MNRGNLMSSKKEEDCRKCRFFRPHDTYNYFGFCVDKNELKIQTLDKEVCDDYKEVSLEDLKGILLRRGWLFCLSCKKALYTVEELVEHINDELKSDLFSDIVASEEVPAAS